MRYRAEIDGLRTLAVLPVIAYHLGIPGFNGGFIGVDIFFVISGFLISGIIYTEASVNGFSFLTFYKRRCLRILPPLFIVLFCTFFAGYIYLLPHQLESLGQSGLATLLFSSNFYFWSQSGYFAGPAAMTPLLHTWSLSVEEQFYIFYPFIVIYSIKYCRNKVWLIILLLSFFSFVASCIGVKVKPEATFYLIPTRAWELGIGGLLAVSNIDELLRKNNYLRQIISILGLMAIFFGFYWLTPLKPFPGYNALLPCLGTFCIIAAGTKSLVAKILSFKPIAYIGMLSYSLYLWHWPIIVFSNIELNISSIQKYLLVLALTFALAILTRYFLELPVKKYFGSQHSKFVVASSLVLLLAFSLVPFYLAVWTPQSIFFTKRAIQISEFSDYRSTKDYDYQFRYGTCFFDGNKGKPDTFDKSKCLAINKLKGNYIVVGDSHGAHIWRALSERVDGNINLMQATAASCKPVISQNVDNPCSHLMKYIFEDFIVHNRIDGIIISARWKKGDLNALISTVKSIKQYVPKIYILGPTVEYNGLLPDLLAYQENSHSFLLSKMVNKSIEPIDLLFQEKLKEMNINYISVYHIFCTSNDVCLAVTSTGEPSAFDYGHLTLDGSRYAASKIVPILLANHFF